MTTSRFSNRRVIALSGGVGGARLCDGIAGVLEPENLLVITNCGDDFVYLGLPICPDLDTVMYTLSGRADDQRGWGCKDESWVCMEALEALGGPGWFRLGDRDLATHLRRRELLAQGMRLGEATRILCRQLGVLTPVVPMCDTPFRTVVETNLGDLDFQEYFVRERCEPSVSGIRFQGREAARPAPEIQRFIDEGPVDAVIVCPSNPYLSIDPIFAVPGMRSLLEDLPCPRIAVSPIIAGAAVKGPLSKIMAELGLEVSVRSIADHYHGFIDQIHIDERDQSLLPVLSAGGIRAVAEPILIQERQARRSLAASVLSSLARL